MMDQEGVDRCSTCGAKLQISPETGQSVCLLCTYEPVEDISEARIEILEDPYAEVQRRLEEDRQVNNFVYALKNSIKDVYVTKALVGLNVAVFITMVSFGVSPVLPGTADVISWGGNLSSATMFGEPWRLFTCMFIHIGVIHVFFNMMVLWTLGDFVEKLFGHVNFLLLYIFSGLIGSLCSIVWNPNVVSAGASGAVFGVFGGLCGYLVACKKDIPLVIFAQMKKNVLVFLGLNLAFGLSVPNIDMAAHMGGLAGGFIAALFLSHSFNEKGLKSISKRGIVFAVFALVSLFSLFSFISSEFKVPFETTFKKFSTLDVKFAKILEEGQSDMATNTLSVEEFIEALEGEVIPEWKRIRLEFIDNRPFGRSNKTYERVDTYMDLKGQLWMNLLKGYRENDASYFEKVEELGKKIEEMNP